MVSSTDGYCTIATFDEGELGKPYIETSSEESAESEEIKSDVVQELAEDAGQDQVLNLYLLKPTKFQS